MHVDFSHAALAALVLWLLWSRRIQGDRPPHLVPRGGQEAHRLAVVPRAARQSTSRDDGEASDDGVSLGPYPRLAAEVADLRHAFKLLQNEWADKESRMDALIKRAHRLRKIEELRGEQEEPPTPTAVPSAAEQRNQILARFRSSQGG